MEMFDPIWMLLIIPLSGILELLVNYFFTRKIYFVSIKDFDKAALNGSIATFIFSSLVVGLGTLIALSGWYEVPSLACAYIFGSAGAISVGNYVGTYISSKNKK